ncbi:MAG: hypothetical protein U1F43_15530 [Myxococcota bacterium]
MRLAPILVALGAVTPSLGSCVERAPASAPVEPPASVSGPPFTLEAALSGDDLVVRVRPQRTLAGPIELVVEGLAGRAVASEVIAPDARRTFRVGRDRGPWRVVARWADPRGVAGATAVRQIPELPEVAPRFEPIRPVDAGGLRIDAAVPIR